MSLFRPVYTDNKTGKRIKSGVWWFEFAYGGNLRTDGRVLASFPARDGRFIDSKFYGELLLGSGPGRSALS
jgi:hypothetical protein